MSKTIKPCSLFMNRDTMLLSILTWNYLTFNIICNCSPYWDSDGFTLATDEAGDSSSIYRINHHHRFIILTIKKNIISPIIVFHPGTLVQDLTAFLDECQVSDFDFNQIWMQFNFYHHPFPSIPWCHIHPRLRLGSESDLSIVQYHILLLN